MSSEQSVKKPLPCDEEPRSGRPRCETAKRSILDAVWRLLKTERLATLSIEAIAREAGVGKTTIYRWWPSKAAVAMDAFLERYLPETGLPETGTPAERLEAQMRSVVKTHRGPLGRLFADILAEGQSDPDVSKLVTEHFIARRRKATLKVVEAGKASGDFDPDIDSELALDILYGPIYFRLLGKHGPLDNQFAEELPKWALRCLQRGRRSAGESLHQ